jgi:hypothetical protein
MKYYYNKKVPEGTFKFLDSHLKDFFSGRDLIRGSPEGVAPLS